MNKEFTVMEFDTNGKAMAYTLKYELNSKGKECIVIVKTRPSKRKISTKSRAKSKPIVQK